MNWNPYRYDPYDQQTPWKDFAAEINAVANFVFWAVFGIGCVIGAAVGVAIADWILR